MSNADRGLCYVLLFVYLMLAGCREKPVAVKLPVEKPVSPIERYVREHFGRQNEKQSIRTRSSQSEDTTFPWVLDSLPIKSIRATLYHIRNTSPRFECIDCDENYVIRNNISGAFFQFYQSAWAANTTKYEEAVLAGDVEPVNADLVGLEAFLNERSTSVTMEVLVSAIDSVLRYSRFGKKRIRNTSTLDSVLHFPKAANSVGALRQALLPKLQKPNVLLYTDGRLPDQVIILYYALIGTGSFYQTNLVHVRIDRALSERESDPYPKIRRP